MTALTDDDLDAVLAIQFMVAWAGEGRCQPKRLGWWETDLIDPAGGGDFFARLLPQTHAWATFESAREAARRTDAKARSKMADPDQMRTLFFLGFEVDEQLNDRLSVLKRQPKPPANSLPLKLTPDEKFSRDAFLATLRQGDVAFEVVPGGRQLKGTRPNSPLEIVTRLATALAPLADTYPLPFFKLEK